MLLDAVVEGAEPLDDIDSAGVGSIDGLEDRDEVVELMDPTFLKHLNASVELGHEPEILTLQPSEIDEGLISRVGVGRNVLVGKVDSVYVRLELTEGRVVDCESVQLTLVYVHLCYNQRRLRLIVVVWRVVLEIVLKVVLLRIVLLRIALRVVLRGLILVVLVAGESDFNVGHIGKEISNILAYLLVVSSSRSVEKTCKVGKRRESRNLNWWRRVLSLILILIGLGWSGLGLLIGLGLGWRIGVRWLGPGDKVDGESGFLD